MRTVDGAFIDALGDASEPLAAADESAWRQPPFQRSEPLRTAPLPAPLPPPMVSSLLGVAQAARRAGGILPSEPVLSWAPCVPVDQVGPPVPIVVVPAAVLRAQVAELQEQLRKQEEEVQELRGVVATKDAILRSLSLEADTASRVVQAKDDIIRGLGEELTNATSRQHRSGVTLSSDIAAEIQPTLPFDTCCSCPITDSLGQDSTSFGGDDVRAFTVLPFSEGTLYVPDASSLVDKRIAAFLNGRRCKMLFTRTERDCYLYGQMLVRCFAGEAESVLVYVDSGNEPLTLAGFVSLYEDVEHARCEHEFARCELERFNRHKAQIGTVLCT